MPNINLLQSGFVLSFLKRSVGNKLFKCHQNLGLSMVAKILINLHNKTRFKSKIQKYEDYKIRHRTAHSQLFTYQL